MNTLETEHARLSQYLEANALTGAGTLEYRKAILAHRLLTDLMTLGGGTSPEHREVMRQLAQIEDGTHPLLAHDVRAANAR